MPIPKTNKMPTPKVIPKAASIGVLPLCGIVIQGIDGSKLDSETGAATTISVYVPMGGSGRGEYQYRRTSDKQEP